MLEGRGVIEGYYGAPWSWEERHGMAEFMAAIGWKFFIYAPKADAFLRRRWQERHPAEAAAALRRFSDACGKLGLEFGIGLSPFNVFANFGTSAQAALHEKLQAVLELSPVHIALLFDDMDGRMDRLAERQAEVIEWVRRRSGPCRLTLCPSYYSDDPILDRVFGARPENYLEDIGRLTDSSVGIFWTGPKVCSPEIGAGHIASITSRLGRAPALWDNYPVNDGKRMSRFLHLRAFSGRDPAIDSMVASHGVNPALQPWLTRIPLLTLNGIEWPDAAAQVLGSGLAALVAEDLPLMQDKGLDALSGGALSTLMQRYAGIDHPAAAEIRRWLSGGYSVGDDLVATQ